MQLRAYTSSDSRRKSIEKKLGIKLPHIAKLTPESEEPVTIENIIGGTLLPLGVAGPVQFVSDFGKREVYIPLATTEGALVASVQRGVKAIDLSGGAYVKTENIGATRAPVFKLSSMKEAFIFRQWIQNNVKQLKETALATSHYLQLTSFSSKVVGNLVYMRLSFDTGEAMGMNMATIASQAVVSYIEKKTKALCISLSSNYCVDKKSAWSTSILGRGWSGWAEVRITHSILSSVLKTTPERVYEVWTAKCMLGSLISGSIGGNAQVANITSSIFAATGQDLAHVVESSMAVTTVHKNKKDVVFSVYLPSLMVGVVGGGTQLSVKKEAIAITQSKNSQELVEVILVAILAGEVSLLSSLSEGSLAEAHKKLGRRKNNL